MQGRVATGSCLRVLVDAPIAQPLDYLRVDDDDGNLAATLVPGARCVVPLGRRSVVGLVAELAAASALAPERLRTAGRRIDDVAPLSPHWLAFTRFAADYYQQHWGEIALPALPLALRSLPRPRHEQSLARLRRWEPPAATSGSVPPRLTAEQEVAVSTLQAAAGFVPSLLFGVTGSGKTEVYLAVIQRLLAADAAAQALLLVPEINLTPQLEAQVRARFAGNAVVTMHSDLAAGARTAAWLAAHEGRARIVVGTRLAIFASMPQLRLIVVDEEHDSSYKAGEGGRYSARDLALKRGQMLGIPVVLGSATPSMESWARTQDGRMQCVRLSQRANAAAMPAEIEIVDARAHPERNGLAAPIALAMEEVFARGEQSLVFLNRRGYAPVVACEACGWLSQCPRCALYSVFHKLDASLRCHHCGWTEAVPRSCPTCGNQALHGLGRGTQRVEESLQGLLPAARIVRIDRDSTRRKHAAERAFDAVHRGEVDVMVGTQMIAKGHDFQRVSLVLVLNPDGQLASHDFRAAERLFALLTQVAGRAGRTGLAGRVLVQTRFPDHPLFSALARHDYAAFADAQLAERRAANMPPFAFQALLTAETREMSRSLDFLRAARAAAPAHAAVRVFDPVPRVPPRLANVERAQLLIEASRRETLQAFLRQWVAWLRGVKTQTRWQLEVDPLEI